jgi:hypothetical protein
MNLLKSLAAVSSITMLSRVLGFVRDTLIARTFGAGMATDAFFIAFKLPNLLRRIFAEGAFSQAFVPILAEYKSQQGEEATRTFIAYVSGLLTLVLALVTVLGMLAAPWVIWVTAPGFTDTPEKFELTSDPAAGDLSLHIADLPVFAGGRDPQYLEPFFGTGLRADAAQCQHDHLCAVPDAVLRSASDGAWAGRCWWAAWHSCSINCRT